MTSLSISTILIVTVIAVQMQANNDCCKKKTVGSKSYTLLESTESFPTKCKNGCIYQEDNTKDTFCFGPGDQPATCAAEEWECKDPEGKLNEIKDLKGDGNKYICTKMGWQPYGCPKLLHIDGIFYRFFHTEFTHCAGSISNCIYISRNRDYCMNGIYPSVTPSEIVPTYSQSNTKNKDDTKSSRTEVVTTLGTPTNGIPFTTIEKIGSLTFFESVYNHKHPIVAGFNWTNSAGEEQGIVGGTQGTLLSSGVCNPPATMPVSPCGQITEIMGSIGYMINNLVFGGIFDVPGAPLYYYFGVKQVPPRDLTPDPSVNDNGHCVLKKIGGRTHDTTKGALKYLEFTWDCFGKIQ